jgi:hypothetical protein
MKVSELSKQYPTIAKWNLENGKNAEKWNMDTAVCDVLNDMEENGHYEMPASQSATGIPVILNMSDLPESERP